MTSTAKSSDRENMISVVVAGQVVKPGPYKVLHKASLQDVLIAAGGCTERSSRVVQVRRAGKDIGSYKIHFDTTKKLLTFESLKNSPNMTQLQDGDILTVGEGAIPLNNWRRWTREQAALRN